jgi:hypothetical protein
MSGLKRALAQPNLERISLTPTLSPLAEAKFAQSRRDKPYLRPKRALAQPEFWLQKGPSAWEDLGQNGPNIWPSARGPSSLVNLSGSGAGSGCAVIALLQTRESAGTAVVRTLRMQDTRKRTL